MLPVVAAVVVVPPPLVLLLDEPLDGDATKLIPLDDPPDPWPAVRLLEVIVALSLVLLAAVLEELGWPPPAT